MRRTLFFAATGLFFGLAACSSNDPTTAPCSTDAGADASKPLSFDPSRGSFGPARNAVDAFVQLGRNAEMDDPNRFFPMRDPVFVTSALSEVLRAKVTTDCVNGAFGCPSPAVANALLAEWAVNEPALVGALKKAQSATHAWGRIALAENLLGVLNLLEQAKALTADDLAALVPAAGTLADALKSPNLAIAGVYPDLSPNAALYKFAFRQIRPALAPSSAHLSAANAFITTVFARLTKNPTDAKTACGELLKRFVDGIIVQGIIVQGIIVQGSEAGQVFESLPYFVTVGEGADPAAVDHFATETDAIVTKVASNTVTAPDWVKYATAIDGLATTFDGPAGALGSSRLIPSVPTTTPKTPGSGLEDDPNVIQRTPTAKMLRELEVDPTVRLITSGPITMPAGERRAPIVMPVGVEVALPSRAVPTIPAPVGLYPVVSSPPIYVWWDQSVASHEFDHFDLRVENLTSKKRVFHKIYRRQNDDTIATATTLPVDASWFQAGSTNELQLRIAAVDRWGRSSGILCGDLAVTVDTGSAWTAAPEKSVKCNAAAIDLGEAPLGDAPALDGVVIGKSIGTPYRPSIFFGTTVKLYNDTSTPRRLVSLFTPDYLEVLPDLDRAVRKSDLLPLGMPPVDTGVIPAHGSITLTLPALAPDDYRFAFYDADAAPFQKVVLVKGTKFTTWW